ncbi:hypothetical protein [Stappia sp. 28M-7]|uniref:hypothetical protein n=1 Tax=Stappia sp. 28M-7 TaxID=2762596 RepID=UPI00163D1067|nr:hypothetical protein [Stappia sp. 28M-7]MBC2860352.1 hypothetical protein [Stappia sp. 28M-7]
MDCVVRVVMVPTFAGLERKPGVFRVGPGDPGTVVVVLSGGAAAMSRWLSIFTGHLLKNEIDHSSELSSNDDDIVLPAFSLDFYLFFENIFAGCREFLFLYFDGVRVKVRGFCGFPDVTKALPCLYDRGAGHPISVIP